MSNLTSESLQHSTPATAQPSACTQPEKTITIGAAKLEKFLRACRKELVMVKRVSLDAARSAERVIDDIDLKLADLSQLN